MNIDIKIRLNQLTSLQSYHSDVEKEVTMILQNLQWDRKHLAERRSTVVCQYDTNHRVPPDKLLEHENGCFLKNCGYSKGDCFLPSPFNPDATTLVKLCANNISKIINDASYCQSSFRTGTAWDNHQPLTLERLQTTYTADERRAIYDAVVDQVPSCHDVSDLEFVSSQDDADKETRAKSKLEILAELRDMRRRRTKYRVAAKTRNYSDVLRDVISTQMDLYNQAHNSVTQLHMKTDDSKSCSKVEIVQDEKKNRQFDNTPNRSYRNTEKEIFTSNKNTPNIPLSTQHANFETRKRRHNESNYRTERYKYHSDSKSKRANVTDNSPKSHRRNHKHIDHYDSRNRYAEIKYGNKEKIRTKDKTKDRRCDPSEYHSYERHYSNRKREDHDQHRNLKSSHKDKIDVSGQKRSDYTRKQKQAVTIKKEKDDTDDSNCTSNETQYTDVNSREELWNRHEKHNSNIKKEGKVYLKNEGDKDYRNKDHRSKSTDNFEHYKQSKLLYSRHTPFTYKDKHKHGT